VPEKIRVNQSILIGFLVDFLSNSAIGFHISLYCLFSLVIHAYAYTFRLFSYLQLAIFFGTSASFISALFYLFHHPLHYSYLDIFIYWITSMILWFPVYFVMRRFRQKFFYA
jgi:rod shape-determining protein MreD